MTKIYINIDMCAVQCVASTDKDIELVFIDHDPDYIEEGDKVMTQGMLDKSMSKEKFHDLDYEYYFSEDSLNFILRGEED